MNGPWMLLLPEELMNRLESHLFPGDNDEHGAVLAAGLVETECGVRLLAREVFLARDGVDYVPGQRGYRMLSASFVRDKILYCRDERLAYLAVHNHGGHDFVDFSVTDLASHERGYPALRDIAAGQVVGALVFARNAFAGDLWLPGGGRVELTEARVVARRLRRLYPKPPPGPAKADAPYDRQARLFGDRGQAILSTMKVGVIGAGGAGSLITEYLSRLGVGHIVNADPDHVETSNLPRVVGSTRWDAMSWLTDECRPAWIQGIGERLAKKKVFVARRVAKAANPQVRFDALPRDITEAEVARQFVDCDYLFLAADSMQARHVFNALVHQYLIPGAQVGAKVPVEQGSGEVLDVFTMFRPVTPDQGCLWCNELISSAKLQEEALKEEERRAQRYVEDLGVRAPSVVTLNAIPAALATDDFLFYTTGLLQDGVRNGYVRFRPRVCDLDFHLPRKGPECLECGLSQGSRFGRGDSYPLPTTYQSTRLGLK